MCYYASCVLVFCCSVLPSGDCLLFRSVCLSLRFDKDCNKCVIVRASDRGEELRQLTEALGLPTRGTCPSHCGRAVHDAGSERRDASPSQIVASRDLQDGIATDLVPDSRSD